MIVTVRCSSRLATFWLAQVNSFAYALKTSNQCPTARQRSSFEAERMVSVISTHDRTFSRQRSPLFVAGLTALSSGMARSGIQ